MTTPAAPTRRTFLVAGAGALAVPVLAACGAAEQDPAPAGPTTGTPTGPTTGPAQAALVSLADLAPGTAVVVEPGPGEGVAVVRDEAGEVHGLSAVCTHRSCLVAARGAELVCPCHGSTFSTADGAVLAGPATQPLPPVELRVEGEDVLLG